MTDQYSHRPLNYRKQDECVKLSEKIHIGSRPTNCYGKINHKIRYGQVNHKKINECPRIYDPEARSIELTPWNFIEQIDHNDECSTISKQEQRSSLRLRRRKKVNAPKNRKSRKRMEEGNRGKFYDYKTSAQERLKWHIELEFMMRKKRKTSELLRLRRYGHCQKILNITVPPPWKIGKSITNLKHSTTTISNTENCQEKISNRTAHGNFRSVEQRAEKMCNRIQLEKLYARMSKTHLTASKSTKNKCIKQTANNFHVQSPHLQDHRVLVDRRYKTESNEYTGLSKEKRNKKGSQPMTDPPLSFNSSANEHLSVQKAYLTWNQQKNRNYTVEIEENIQAYRGVQGRGICRSKQEAECQDAARKQSGLNHVLQNRSSIPIMMRERIKSSFRTGLKTRIFKPTLKNNIANTEIQVQLA